MAAINMKNREFSLIRSSVIVSGIILLSKALSFVRDMLLAQKLGASALSDSFLLSTSLLLTLPTFIISPFSTAYLPIATDISILGRPEDKKNFYGRVYGASLVIGLILMVLSGGLLQPFIRTVVVGFSPEETDILFRLMLLQLPVIPLFFLDSVNSGNLRLLNRVGLSETSSGILSAVYAVYLIAWSSSLSIEGLAICVVSAYAISFTVRYMIIRYGDIHISWDFHFLRDPKIRQLGTAMLPYMLATGARELNALVDRGVASLLDTGSITIQTYASKLTLTEMGLISFSISMVIFVEAAKDNAENNIAALKESVITGLKFINILMIPCCIYTIIFKNEIISLLFGRGAFTAENVRVTANTMMIYAVGMCGIGVGDVLTRTLHATKHRKYPATISTLSVFLNTLLNLLLYKPFGVYGLAAATSFVYLIKIPFYVIYVHKKIFAFEPGDHILKDALSILGVSLSSALLAWILKGQIAEIIPNNLITLCIAVIVGAALYFGGLLWIKNEYALGLLKKFKPRK